MQYLVLTKIGVDTTENEPLEVWVNIFNIIQSCPYRRGPLSVIKIGNFSSIFFEKRRLKKKPHRHLRGRLGRPDWLPGGFAGLADRFPGRSLAFAPWNRCYRSKPHHLCSKTLRLRREKKSLFSLHTSWFLRVRKTIKKINNTFISTPKRDVNTCTLTVANNKMHCPGNCVLFSISMFLTKNARFGNELALLFPSKFSSSPFFFKKGRIAELLATRRQESLFRPVWIRGKDHNVDFGDAI